MRTIKTFSLLLLGLFVAIAAEAQTDSVRHHRSLRQRLHAADSLRLELRRAADEGRMLQWGDSLLQARLQRGEIDSARYAKSMRRLRRIDRRLHRGDSLLARNYGKISYDTLYIRRPAGRWTVKLRGNLSGAMIKAEGFYDDRPFNGKVKADYRGTMSVAVAYRGISLGLAINPAKLAGKSKDNEFNLNSYGNKFGFDVVFLNSKTYHGNIMRDGVETPVSKGMVSQKALNVNAYYAFNGRRFSIPAAFSQSYVQRRSAGSFMLGLSFDGQITDIEASEATSNQPIKLKIMEIGLGAGYGYNFVLGRRWLVHLSALPTFDVFVKSHLQHGDDRVNLKFRFPSFIAVGRSAAVYSWKNKFAGASMVFNFSGFGSKDQLHLNRSKWRLRVFYGFRF